VAALGALFAVTACAPRESGRGVSLASGARTPSI
jgi:hypothetical protein